MGFLPFKFLVLFINDGRTIKSAIIDEKNNINGMDFKPKKVPIAAISLASPKPIASKFFNFLYKKIIIHIVK